MRDFIDWVARWTLAPARHGAAHGDPRPKSPRRRRRKFGIVAAGPAPARMTRRARPRARRAAETPAATRQGGARRDGGMLGGRDRRRSSTRARWRSSPCRPSRSRRGSIRISGARSLNADQRPAAEDLGARVADRAFSTTLLEGVTGSGKTEVYFEAIAEALAPGRQALILLPEIALTAQFLDRFAARFGARPAEWHSGVQPRQRERVWGAVAERRGARRRSARARPCSCPSPISA